MYIKQNTSNVGRAALYIFTAIFISFIVVMPEKASYYAKNGIIIWYKSVLPVMFPFLTAAVFSHKIGLSSYLAKISSSAFEKIFSINGYGTFAVICAVLSGYPMGAKITGELMREGKISLSESKKLLALCNITSPAFIVGSVGLNMFKNRNIGILILICHYLSAIMLSFFVKSSRSEININFSHKKFTISSALSYATADASQTLISICCFITLFSVISGFLENISNIFNLPKNFIIFLFAFTELTNGCIHISENISAASICAASAAVSFGGLCIFFQTTSVIGSSAISKRYLILLKTAHAALSALLCRIILAWIV